MLIIKNTVITDLLFLCPGISSISVVRNASSDAITNSFFTAPICLVSSSGPVNVPLMEEGQVDVVHSNVVCEVRDNEDAENHIQPNFVILGGESLVAAAEALQKLGSAVGQGWFARNPGEKCPCRCRQFGFAAGSGFSSSCQTSGNIDSQFLQQLPTSQHF